MSIETRRQSALDNTFEPLTVDLLTRLTRMISHPAPSGTSEICYQDADLGGAISCSQSEIRLLNILGRFVQSGNCLEIGSYVGWSSAALMLNNPKLFLHCMDACIEGAGHLLNEPDMRVMERFIENMEILGLRNWHFYRNQAPEELGLVMEMAEVPAWDFVFLDGWHLGGQPLRDVQGLLPHLSENTVLCMHDMWMTDVFEAAKYLVFQGWNLQSFPTPNILSVLWKNEPKWWKKFRQEAQG